MIKYLKKILIFFENTKKDYNILFRKIQILLCLLQFQKGFVDILHQYKRVTDSDSLHS